MSSIVGKWVSLYMVYRHCGVAAPIDLRWDSMSEAVAFVKEECISKALP